MGAFAWSPRHLSVCHNRRLVPGFGCCGGISSLSPLQTSPGRSRTGGDLLIATASLVLALLLYAERSWSEERFVRVRVAAAAIALGTGHTVFSEWLSTEVCGGSWAYTDPMPVVPFLGTGLSPLAQRLAIPPAAFWWARRSAARNLPRAHPWPTCP